MTPSAVIDTSTISPLTMPTAPSGYSPAPKIQSDSIPPMTLPPAQAAAMLQGSGTAPPTTSTAIPDITQMQSELQTTNPGSHPVVTNPISTAPLSHLQPTNLTQTPDGPIAPAPTTPVVPAASQTIQLASTAPTLKAPTLTQVVYQAKAKAEETQPAHHYIISGILIVLTVVSVSVLALFMLQQYQLSQAEAAELGTTSNSLLDFILERVPFFAREPETQAPEAVWYQ